MPPVPLTPRPRAFPAVDQADEDGLLAIGGDLLPQTLRLAYTHGIFPWYNPGWPILWWSPDPRCVIDPSRFTPSRSLRKRLKSGVFTITVDKCFTQVMRLCAAPRSYANSTWINEEMIRSYTELHLQGLAHSVEVWNASGELVGGLYGMNLGRLFFGESMFSRETDASKTAFAFLMHLCAGWGFPLVDCQLPNEHLMSLGAFTIPREQFMTVLATERYRESPDWRPVQAINHCTPF
ncbi:leucyl/phenylalanyl-tRNA--protein transferase [Fluviicoccus keumensis]|uniref:Leucyl/phenylalanyl-tRNA--protein transferase n=1 Tax=Fluviicoccus keumensis TaxID=1435465 RepID=A0A4Q7Z6J8_9GAMM|nr:leucyl/phenylalanyl-tRNA--protein transferase [Fluviicoccus keumensis]RZU45289.1 leucyl/phenylalanyl-tRNA--protein transferase [Fluviicoccus keumensis]